MTATAASLDDVFFALGDPTRRAVMERLAKGAASVKDLARPFTMALPSFMQHLKVLEEGGLIRSRKEGRSRICELNPAVLNEAEDWLGQQRAIWETRFDQMDAYVMKLKAATEGEDK